ncbi:MAG: fibronectin type III domain-containing protein [Pseudolabrys sp.]
MDWLILILGVPAILVPLVLLFGFAGCGVSAGICTDDTDCVQGTQCVDGACVSAGDPGEPIFPPSTPENLAAIAIDDRSVSLTWTNTEPAATSFRIERAPEAGEFAAIPAPADLSPTGATDASPGLQEGVTFIYRVRALVGPQVSAPSDDSFATVLPAAPVSFVATAAGFGIDLSWTNASTVATEFSLERRVPGGTFTEILPGPGASTTFSDTGSDIGGLSGGTTYEYQVFAKVDGFENSQPEAVKSLASATRSATTLAFTAAFTGALATDQPGNEGVCLVQRLSQSLLVPNVTGTQVGLVLRGSTTGSLTLDNVFISKVGNTGDPYDAEPTDLTLVASNVTIPPNTTRTVGPANYALDPTQDLLVAFDISSTPNEGNVRFGTLLGGDAFQNLATAEAGVPDRTSGYIASQNALFLIEKIEVL